MEGFGVQKRANGDIYQGEFKDNLRNSFGVCKYADGTMYEGMWKMG